MTPSIDATNLLMATIAFSQDDTLNIGLQQPRRHHNKQLSAHPQMPLTTHVIIVFCTAGNQEAVMTTDRILDNLNHGYTFAVVELLDGIAWLRAGHSQETPCIPVPKPGRRGLQDDPTQSLC